MGRVTLRTVFQSLTGVAAPRSNQITLYSAASQEANLVVFKHFSQISDSSTLETA